MRIEETRTGLAGRLRARRGEIEEAALARVNSVADPGESADSAYREGLRVAVSAALEYGIEAVGRSAERPPPMPTALLAQARLAARHGVGLETVLRRYFAGYALLGDFLIEESGRGGRPNAASLKRLLRTQASLLDRLIAAVSEEYAREAAARAGSSEERPAELVRRLLDGELLDTAELGYPFEGWHLGILASGAEAAGLLRRLTSTLDRILLLVQPDHDTVWAWFGGRLEIESAEIGRIVSFEVPAGLKMAIGEPAVGMAGWRLSHRQAQAALPVALRTGASFVRYADVATLASALQDELLSTSLRQLYLRPLSDERAGGAMLRTTLRSYFAFERNTSSAAASLGVSRQAVARRLRTVEERLDRPLASCGVELEIALQLGELDAAAKAPRALISHEGGDNVQPSQPQTQHIGRSE